MGIPKYAERIAVLETKFDALKGTVEVGFRDIALKIDAASLNGETPRVRYISKRLGDPGDVEVLAQLVESHRRRTWILSPLKGAEGYVVNAILWFTTAGALAGLHYWLHATFPHAIP